MPTCLNLWLTAIGSGFYLCHPALSLPSNVSCWISFVFLLFKHSACCDSQVARNEQLRCSVFPWPVIYSISPLHLPGAGDSEWGLQKNCFCIVSSLKLHLCRRQLLIGERTGGTTQHTLNKIGVWGWNPYYRTNQIQLKIPRSVIYLPLITEQHRAEDRKEKRGKITGISISEDKQKCAGVVH